MTFRLFSAVCVLALLSGCQWDSRPDGNTSHHSNRDGYSDGAGYGSTEVEVVEPLGDAVVAPAGDTTPPASGTMDAPSEVEQPLPPDSTP